MSFYLAHSGSKLYKVDTAGVAIELSLPAGVTISTSRDRRGRFSILDRTVIFTTAPSLNLQIDPNLVVRILTPTTPVTTPVTAAGAAGLLTGSFRYGVTFAIMTGTRVVSESGMSDPSLAVTLTAQQGALSSIPVSLQPGVNARRIWRTLNGGEEFFLAGTISDNTTTTFNDNTSDEEAAAGLLLPELGQPPGATISDYIEETIVWKDRAWALSHNEPDKVRYSDNGVAYAWPEENFVNAKPVGADLEGGTGFLARRDELGIGKRRKFMKVIGNDESDFEVLGVHDDVGIWAPRSCVVIRDVGYFLAEDGVYEFGPRGVLPLSREKVHPWFTTDDYFNRAKFHEAFANYNQRLDGYQLFLASAGSEVIDRWVFLDMKTRNWYGPHKTAAFTPTCASVFEDNDGLVVPVLGDEDGQIWRMNQPSFRDGDEAIDMDVLGKFHAQGDPNTTKVWGPLTVFSKQESDGILTIEARVGGLDARMGPIAVTSMARAAQDPTTLISVVTVATAEEHQFGDGADIEIDGAVETDYNGTWTITRIDASTFTFELPTVTPTTPATGTITALDPARRALEHDLTLSREVVGGGGLGVGELAQLRFRESTIDQGVRLYGYMVDPVTVIGTR
jgi:hypothetical protein